MILLFLYVSMIPLISKLQNVSRFCENTKVLEVYETVSKDNPAIRGYLVTNGVDRSDQARIPIDKSRRQPN